MKTIARTIPALIVMLFLAACNSGSGDDDGLSSLVLSGTASAGGVCATTQGDAVLISVGSSATAAMSDSGWCYFRFIASSTSSHEVTLEPFNTDLDIYMSFEDGSIGRTTTSSNWQYSSVNLGTVDDIITQTTTAGAERYLGVFDFDDTGGNFRVSVSN